MTIDNSSVPGFNKPSCLEGYKIVHVRDVVWGDMDSMNHVNNTKYFYYCGDVRDRGALADLLASLAPYDILISAATGGDRALGPFMEMDLDQYQASFDKLWGYVNVVRLGAPFLVDNGSIVLLSGSPARRARPPLMLTVVG